MKHLFSFLIIYVLQLGYIECTLSLYFFNTKKGMIKKPAENFMCRCKFNTFY